ncbi:hypothetical protein D3C72_1828780 [compost metagenome]
MRGGARPVAVAKINRGIELGIGEQERPGTVGQVDRDLRVQALEILQAWQQPLGAEGRHHRQFDAHGALLAHHRQGVALHRVQLRGHPSRVGQAGLGQLDPAPRTAKQFDVEKLLQPGDLPADGALGQGQFLGRLGEALVAGGGFEGHEGGGTGNLPTHAVPQLHNWRS